MAIKVITAPVEQWRAAGRVVGWTLGVCLAVLVGYWSWSEATHFLQQDSRFLLAVPDLGESSCADFGWVVDEAWDVGAAIKD